MSLPYFEAWFEIEIQRHSYLSQYDSVYKLGCDTYIFIHVYSYIFKTFLNPGTRGNRGKNIFYPRKNIFYPRFAKGNRNEGFPRVYGSERVERLLQGTRTRTGCSDLFPTRRQPYVLCCGEQERPWDKKNCFSFKCISISMYCCVRPDVYFFAKVLGWQDKLWRPLLYYRCWSQF